MSEKIYHFNEIEIAVEIHTYLLQLPGVEYDESANGPTIGYKHIDQTFKMATMHGGAEYQSLVLHVDPDNRLSTLGKKIQKEIEEILNFDIKQLRTHPLKANEVYIPLEKLDYQDPISRIKEIIHETYEKQESTITI
ncbi:hypothetical protein SAMN05216389_11542 [Oceanobacillus limi]|uniref:Uncharacterized protein n=1 Tax=Oceanobacillus limi TaxID=930131 RepID=A0A1I0FH26_9BACI|nr:hypothetical protein [Oceanobacillus limi]SET57336.1 hypothetical protein SAMN05216389_11542 [Oceanobacillus limi]